MTNVQLTVCTDRPLWCAELVVREAGEAVVVLAVVADKPVVGGAGIALVQHRLIVGRGVVGVPHQQEAAVAGGAGGLHTVGPCSAQFYEAYFISVETYIHSCQQKLRVTKSC